MTFTQRKRAAFACAVISQMGGAAAAARLCNVDAQTLADWRHHGIPADRLSELRQAHPAVFAELNGDGVYEVQQ